MLITLPALEDTQRIVLVNEAFVQMFRYPLDVMPAVGEEVRLPLPPERPEGPT